MQHLLERDVDIREQIPGSQLRGVVGVVDVGIATWSCSILAYFPNVVARILRVITVYRHSGMRHLFGTLFVNDGWLC